MEANPTAVTGLMSCFGWPVWGSRSGGETPELPGVFHLIFWLRCAARVKNLSKKKAPNARRVGASPHGGISLVGDVVPLL
jgi:hypothetical protein